MDDPIPQAVRDQYIENRTYSDEFYRVFDWLLSEAINAELYGKNPYPSEFEDVDYCRQLVKKLRGHADSLVYTRTHYDRDQTRYTSGWKVFVERIDTFLESRPTRLAEKVRAVERIYKIAERWRQEAIDTIKWMENRVGYVYLVYSSDLNSWKIGRSKDAEKRTKRFEVKLPVAIELDHVIPSEDCVDGEKALAQAVCSSQAGWRMV